MPLKRKRNKIIRELPAIGTKLIGKFFGKQYKAQIVKDDFGSNGRMVKFNGKLFKSLTGAAQEITKQPVNGWRFWRF